MMTRLRQLKEHLRPLPGFVGSGDVVVVGNGVSGDGDGGNAFSLLALLTTFRWSMIPDATSTRF